MNILLFRLLGIICLFYLGNMSFLEEEYWDNLLRVNENCLDIRLYVFPIKFLFFFFVSFLFFLVHRLCCFIWNKLNLDTGALNCIIKIWCFGTICMLSLSTFRDMFVLLQRILILYGGLGFFPWFAAGLPCSFEHVKTEVYFARTGFEDVYILVCGCSTRSFWIVFAWSEDLLFSQTIMGISSKAFPYNSSLLSRECFNGDALQASRMGDSWITKTCFWCSSIQ